MAVQLLLFNSTARCGAHLPVWADTITLAAIIAPGPELCSTSIVEHCWGGGSSLRLGLCELHSEAVQYRKRLLLGPVAGFKYITSTFSERLHNFITLFTEFRSALTTKTGDSYLCPQSSMCAPQPYMLMLAVSIIGSWSGGQNKVLVFYHRLFTQVYYPFLDERAMLAQPDWFSLITSLCHSALTLDTVFESWSRAGSCRSSPSWQQPPLS